MTCTALVAFLCKEKAIFGNFENATGLAIFNEHVLYLSYNQSQNILRLFDVLSNFTFTIIETMGDYYLKTLYLPVASRVAEQFKT